MRTRAVRGRTLTKVRPKLAWLLIAISPACRDSGVFGCEDDSVCVSGSVQGVCQVNGLCSFPDPACESGQRYGKHSGNLSGSCVPVDGAADSTGGEEHGGGDSSVGDAPGTESGDGDESTGGSQVLVFTDEQYDGQFGEGQFESISWSGDRLERARGAAFGVFTSRVFDAQVEADWRTLQWLPVAPYGRRLPSDGGTEVYAFDAADMADNVLLMRFDGGDLSEGTAVADASEVGSDGTVVGSGLSLGSGPFGAAVVDDGSSHVTIPVGLEPPSALSFGTSDFTFALWVRTTSSCAGNSVAANQVYMGIEDSGPDRTFLWLGCIRPQAGACSGNAPGAGGFAGAILRSRHDDDDGAGLCGTTDIVDGQWHHLVVTKTGHPAAQVTLYLDGTDESSDSVSFLEPLSFAQNTEFVIGALTGGVYSATASYDEVAVWRRALSAEEVAALYRRGALRLELQVRVCDEPGCADAPAFVGPHADAAARYVDDGASPIGSNPVQLGPLPAGRYFQYRARFEADGELVETALGPALRSVTVEALR